MTKVVSISRRTAMISTALCVSTATFAAQAPQTRFDPTQVVAGKTLYLNGSGTRYKAIFKVYDLALYTPKKVTTAKELFALEGPIRLNFVALRELPGTDVGLSFIRGLTNNTSPDQIRRHVPSSNRLIEIFSGKRSLEPGDSFAIEYVPGKGTTFYITGQAQGAPVGDAEFFDMVLKVWTGDVPADFKLKDALLGAQ